MNNRSGNIWSRFTAVVALALGLSGGANAADPTVRFAIDGYAMGSLVQVAAAKGYFAEQNIDAKVLTFAYGTDTIDAVLAGQADFGVIIDMPLLTRLSSGKLMAPAIVSLPLPGWHKLYAEKGISKPADLKGKSLGIAAGTAQEFVTRSYLKDNGVDPEKDVKLVKFQSIFEIVGAMKAGRIDAAWVWAEGVAAVKDDPKFKFVADDGVVKQGTSALLVTSRQFATEHRDLVIRSLKAMGKAEAIVKSDSQQAADIAAKGIGGDAAKIKPILESQRFNLNFGAKPIQAIKDKYDFLVSNGLIKTPYVLADQFDLSMLREAMPGADVASGVPR